jgi:hypothetical protein
MVTRTRLRIGLLAIVMVTLLVVLFAPVLVSRGVQLWLWWKTHGTEVTITTESIEAPFLHPMVMRGVRIKTQPPAAVQINVSANRVVFGLNLKSILLRTRGPTLRNLAIEGMRVEARRIGPSAALSENGWNTIYRLLPESFAVAPFDVRIEDGASLLLIRNGSLTGSPVEAGRFEAGEVVVSSPLFRQTFGHLKGATDWQANRLTIAALTLSRGLDVQSVVTDLSHLGKQRIGLEFDVDAFGGKLRGSVADEWRSRRSNWTIAGSANDISLSQTAEAFGFTDRIGGLVHAGKFTFRGDLDDALTGTASLWLELTGPAWRDREADLITLGLSLYGRQLELQQLYIKQKKNELTLNGESSFPTTAAGWLRPDFRGTVSASIDDLGEFASLFGGNRNDFAGQIEVEGTLGARDRNVGGNLVANGFGLTMFKSSIDEFHAELRLKKEAIEIGQVELKRQNDSLRARGSIDTSPGHNYSGTIDATIENIDQDLSLIWGLIEPHPISATLHAQITSGVWEAQAIFDPAQSKPVTVSATFPLRIGQPMEALWTSPVTLTIDSSQLYLAELPHRPSAVWFTNGTTAVQLTMTDTPRHPRAIGYAELLDTTLGPSRFDSRIRFEGNRAVIESVMLKAGQATASFYGDIDLQDTQQLQIHLIPNQYLFDVNPPTLDCAAKVDLLQVSSAPDPPVEEIQIARSANEPNWTVTLKEPGATGLSIVTGAGFASKTYRFCLPEKRVETALQLGVEQPPATPSPSPTPRPRKRKH